jgi:hypothetical protein
MIWCCGLTKEHLATFIYWAVHCWQWSRKASGRDKVSYRQYRPLRNLDDSLHGSKHGKGGMDDSRHSVCSLDSRFSDRKSEHGEPEDGAGVEDSSDDDGLQIAPADRGHERGQWLRSFTK